MLAVVGPLVVPWIGLKQVVDCRLPARASYQSIVFQGIKFVHIGVPGSIRSAFDVKISRYESLPIVDTLGLRVKRSETGDYTTVDTICANWAIWLRVDLQDQEAVNVASRAGDSEWYYADKSDFDDFKNVQKIWQMLIRNMLKLLVLLWTLIAPHPVPDYLKTLKSKLAIRIKKAPKKKS